MRKKVHQPKLVVIGGGTGSFTLLSELKQLTPDITAIVNMSDDGGSTGRLRDELGTLPPGDIRQCLVALSTIPEARELFNIRFDSKGPLDEHNLGNLILSGLEHHYGDFEKAVEVAAKLLNIVGQVVPVTTTAHTLVLKDGSDTIKGEFAIGHYRMKTNERTLSHEPAVTINPRARQAIMQADMVVIAPGNLYGSLLPALSVSGMGEALQKTKAKVIMVANLVTKPSQTDGWHITTYVTEMERYIGEGTIDTVLYNTKRPERSLLKRYAAEGELPVGHTARAFKISQSHTRYVGKHLLAGTIWKRQRGDHSMPRTLIRHDAKRVATELRSMLNG